MDNSKILNESNAMINQAELLGSIDKILIKSSIALRVSDKQPLIAPVGIVSGAQWDKDDGKLTIAKKDISAITRKIRTEFTKEALLDLKTIYKESFYDVLAHYLIDELTYKIDADFIDMIHDRAVDKGSFDFKGDDFDNALWAVGQSIAISVNKGLCDLPISDNRSSQGWAVVSSNVASLLEGVLDDSSKEGLDDDSPSYLGRLAGTDYFINYTHPNDGTDNVIFGIKGNGISKGSTIYSHYTKQWIEAQNPDNGEPIFFLMDRTGMTINPLDDKYYDNGNGDSGFIGKISFDLSDLKIFK